MKPHLHSPLSRLPRPLPPDLKQDLLEILEAELAPRITDHRLLPVRGTAEPQNRS